MIERLSEKIALVIKAANPDKTESVLKMKYALSVYLHLLSIFIFCVIIGLITGKAEETIVALLAFVILRSFSGGKHINSLEGCLIVSVILISIIPHIPVKNNYVVWINTTNVLVMTLFAPLIKELTNIPTKAIPYLKIISVIIVSINFYINSYVIALAFLSQAALLVFWRR